MGNTSIMACSWPCCFEFLSAADDEKAVERLAIE